MIHDRGHGFPDFWEDLKTDLLMEVPIKSL